MAGAASMSEKKKVAMEFAIAAAARWPSRAGRLHLAFGGTFRRTRHRPSLLAGHVGGLGVDAQQVLPAPARTLAGGLRDAGRALHHRWTGDIRGRDSADGHGLRLGGLNPPWPDRAPGALLGGILAVFGPSNPGILRVR